LGAAAAAARAARSLAARALAAWAAAEPEELPLPCVVALAAAGGGGGTAAAGAPEVACCAPSMIWHFSDVCVLCVVQYLTVGGRLGLKQCVLDIGDQRIARER